MRCTPSERSALDSRKKTNVCRFARCCGTRDSDDVAPEKRPVIESACKARFTQVERTVSAGISGIWRRARQQAIAASRAPENPVAENAMAFPITPPPMMTMRIRAHELPHGGRGVQGMDGISQTRDVAR
ncbi:hypothetical protein GO998_22585 (plasmid) [Ralstonia syzygii]|uniref:Uncharacterized protein n=1 Tax=Ralstonia syzygii TaxID=28097 RepID=A0ABX7ZNX8_9RALS|nr:hypothetical protein GO998_22585 [Ralstonia syzygii]